MFAVMKNNTIWSVFVIASFLSWVYCSPVAEPGHTNTSNGYKLEILSKNNPHSEPIQSKSFWGKLDFSALHDTVVKHVVPALLQAHEKGSPPGKETTHQLSTSITESLTKNLSDAFNSKLGQEIMIAAGIKERPTLLETIYQTIAEYITWIGTLASNKVHEVKQKGALRTFSDTFSGVFGSNGHFIPSPHETHKSIPATQNTKNPQLGTEAVMQTRGLGLINEIIGAASSSNHGHPGYGSHHHPGPWNNFFYQPYNRYNNPYSTMPSFVGDGPFAYIGHMISSIFYFIQEFFFNLFSHGTNAYPPPRGRPSLFQRPL